MFRAISGVVPGLANNAQAHEYVLGPAFARRNEHACGSGVVDLRADLGEDDGSGGDKGCAERGGQEEGETHGDAGGERWRTLRLF